VLGLLELSVELRVFREVAYRDGTSVPSLLLARRVSDRYACFASSEGGGIGRRASLRS
jgi:hypothetical protein